MAKKKLQKEIKIFCKKIFFPKRCFSKNYFLKSRELKNNQKQINGVYDKMGQKKSYKSSIKRANGLKKFFVKKYEYFILKN